MASHDPVAGRRNGSLASFFPGPFNVFGAFLAEQ